MAKLFKRRRPDDDREASQPTSWPISPPVALAAAFLVLIVVGTGLLKLPFATETPLTWSDALFTATSAVTVTGLVVQESGIAFSFWGELVLVILMQAGGLGLMTFAVVALLALGGKIQSKPEFSASQAFDGTDPAQVWLAARAVLRVALVFEVLGLLPLAWAWIPEYGWLQGFWWALFHSVSAFNNAGFVLGNFSAYVGHPAINLTLSMLYLVGGLGFAVVATLWDYPKSRRLDVNTKVVLTGTVLLSVAGTLAILLLEANNPDSLAGLPSLSDRLWAAWLQATTPRTAGFNTLEIASLTQPTLIILMLLMFIGAGSNGTGSGIKVTTFMVLMAATWAFIRRRQVPVLFAQAVDRETLLKALAVAVMAILGMFMGVLALSITEHAPFLPIAFEVISAMGTVGLSMGLTEELSEGGRMIVMMLMFVGRLCPLTMAYFVGSALPAGKSRSRADIQIG